MVFQVAILIIIPIFLGIVFVPPFEPPEKMEEIDIPKEPPAEIPNRDILYFGLMLIWLFFLIRILFQIRRGTFKIQKKF